MKTKVVAVLLLCAMLVVPCQTVFAFEQTSDYEVAPAMTYIADYSIAFSITDGKANVDAMVDGFYLTATRAKVIAELQVKNGNSWIPVKIWTDDQNDYTACVYESYKVTSGNTYRVKATFTVWEGSASETVTSYSSQKTA